MSMSGDDNVTERRRRRRKRIVSDIKDAINEDKEEDQGLKDSGEALEDGGIAEELVELQPRARAPVTLEVQDVRGLVGGASSAQATTGSTTTVTEAIDNSAPMALGDSLQTTTDGTAPDDSFAQLLEDARRMKEDGGENGDGDESLKVKARNILSTVVTADFFVVCGFLLWFLAGIGFRALFNDDSVQIAFNNNFELLVQPALGVLMLGTIVGNFLKDEEEEA